MDIFKTLIIENPPTPTGGGGSGTVTSVSVTTANGVSGSVNDPTTTPSITLALGAITPATVNGVTLSGSSTPTLAVTGTTAVSGTNTGNQTISITGDATAAGSAGVLTATVTKVNGVTFSTLATGILKNTTGTGAPSVAVAATDFVAPSAYASANGLTMATARILGRTTASTGAAEEITIGSGLLMSSGTLTATGGGGGGGVSAVDVSGGTTGLTTSGGPITTSGTITLAGTLDVDNGGTGATTAGGARTNLGAAASGANSDITGLSGVTNAISSPTEIQMGNGNAVTLAAGKMWYSPNTGAWNMGMGNGAITQQVGEELFVYGKASAAINDSPLQIVYQTGTVGASGVITMGPTITGLTNSVPIIGIATEPISINGFGRVTAFGIVHGITTDGSAYSETWLDGDVIYYNPVTGNPTKVKPVAPNIKVSVGTIIKAGSGGSGSFQVEVTHGSELGGTDSNVQLTSPSDTQLLQYFGAGGYWRNVAATTVGVTSFSAGSTGLTPASGTQGAVTLAGTLALANGGTGATTAANARTNLGLVIGTDVLAPNGSAASLTSFPTLNQNTTGTAANVTGTVALANGGTGATTAANARVNLQLNSSDNVTFGTVSDSLGNVRAVPQNAQSSSYAIAASDSGKHVSITTGGVTVNSGIFSIGQIVTIYNNSGSNQTITQGAVTLRHAGTASTGNRTLAQYGVATILCVASNMFVVSGAGLT